MSAMMHDGWLVMMVTASIERFPYKHKIRTHTTVASGLRGHNILVS